MRESHELEFAVVCVFVFELRVEAVKFCYDAALFPLFFPCFPAHLRFPVEVAHRPECPPDDGADAAPYGAPEYATPLPPEQMQRKEYADYPAGLAIILHDKLPNIKDDFLGYCHGLGGAVTVTECSNGRLLFIVRIQPVQDNN